MPAREKQFLLNIHRLDISREKLKHPAKSERRSNSSRELSHQKGRGCRYVLQTFFAGFNGLNRKAGDKWAMNMIHGSKE
jgi:hypothetical protein